MTAREAERRLVLAYAPAHARGALAAILALDDALAQLVRTTREPALGQIRLAWWRERIEALDTAPPPAEPVLQAIAAALLPAGIRGAEVAEVTSGWEVLVLAERLDARTLRRFAEGRGRVLGLAGRALGLPDSAQLRTAGAAWALADLARGLGSVAEAAVTRTMARRLFMCLRGSRWPRRGRAAGALALLAARDLDLPPGADPPVGSPRRLARLMWFAATGR